MNTEPRFFACDDGALYDTTPPQWPYLPPLRATYKRHFGRIENGDTGVAELQRVKATLRAGDFCWPGGYELTFITRDGAALCFDCVRAEWRQVVWDHINDASTGWRIWAVHNTADSDEPTTCDHCGREIGGE